MKINVTEEVEVEIDVDSTMLIDYLNEVEGEGLKNFLGAVYDMLARVASDDVRQFSINYQGNKEFISAIAKRLINLGLSLLCKIKTHDVDDMLIISRALFGAIEDYDVGINHKKLLDASINAICKNSALNLRQGGEVTKFKHYYGHVRVRYDGICHYMQVDGPTRNEPWIPIPKYLYAALVMYQNSISWVGEKKDGE